MMASSQSIHDTDAGEAAEACGGFCFAHRTLSPLPCSHATYYQGQGPGASLFMAIICTWAGNYVSTALFGKFKWFSSLMKEMSRSDTTKAD
jgi:hypothetical protein